MKKCLIAMTVFLFFANTLVVSGWVKPCLMNGGGVVVQQETETAMADMPCHGEEKTSGQDGAHCAGLCLCAHVVASQSFVGAGGVVMAAPAVHDLHFVFGNDAGAAWAFAPPHPPPEYYA